MFKAKYIPLSYEEKGNLICMYFLMVILRIKPNQYTCIVFKSKLEDDVSEMFVS